MLCANLDGMGLGENGYTHVWLSSLTVHRNHHNIVNRADTPVQNVLEEKEREHTKKKKVELSEEREMAEVDILSFLNVQYS